MCNVLTRTDSVIINYKLEIGSIKVKTMGGGGGGGGGGGEGEVLSSVMHAI